MIPAYVSAICQEIEQVASAGRATWGDLIPVHTIFFGGGTPSLLSGEHFAAILGAIQSGFRVLPEAEMTIEANPGTVTLEYLQALRRLGINRLSFGMQSAHPDDLRLLERQHDTLDVIQAVKWARQAGFDNLSLDLIFGLPEQDLARWEATLQRALDLSPEHLSLYALTIEHGTPLEKRYRRGLIPEPDGDLAADMYEAAMRLLGQAGYVQYEISNWARPKPGGGLYVCRHNLQYWYNRPYLGFGAGAHGFAYGLTEGQRRAVRTINVGGIRPFIERCQRGLPADVAFPSGPATRRTIVVDERVEMQETMMVGLRLTEEGVSPQTFDNRFGRSLHSVFGGEIERLLRLGLLEWHNGQDDENTRLRLTPHGRLLGNQVFMQFVG